MRQSLLIISGAFSIMHPTTCRAGSAAIQHLKSDPTFVKKAERLPTVLEHWCIPFSALSIVCNRITPFHRDNGGSHEWMDVLLAAGDYENGRFEASTVGIRCEYQPGTLIGLTGRVLRHGADCPPNRACIAMYNIGAVLKAAGISDVGWARLNDLPE